MNYRRTFAAVAISLLVVTMLLTSCAPRGDSLVEGDTIPGVSVFKMVGNKAGWALKGGSVLRTSDGGRTWKDVSPADGKSPEETRAEFLDATHAWLAVGMPQTDPEKSSLRIYRTANGGSTWETSDIAEAAIAGRLTFLNADEGWVVLHEGVAMMHEMVAIYGTTDGGKTWSHLSSASVEGKADELPFAGDKSGLSFATKDKGFVTGYWPIPGNPYLFATTDGGLTWSQAKLPLPVGYEQADYFTYPPVFHSSGRGVLPATVSGDKREILFYSTEDGGQTWTAGSPIPATGGGLTWDSPSPGLIIVAAGSNLQVSRDSGKTWSSITSNIDLGETPIMSFISEKTGWVLTQGKLYRTVDGGKTWKRP